MFDESPAQAWKLRFGSDAPALPDLGKFLNHRCVRRYKQEPISEEIAQGLVASAQSAATSSNLQLWSVISVQDPEKREALAQVASDQNHVREAAWFFVFLADHRRMQTAAASVGEQALGLQFTEFYTMAVIDAALAAERMVCAAESLGIGICYIGALRNDPGAVAQILNLPDGVFPVFGLSLGWPEEPLTAEIKPRLAPENVWFREEYPAEIDVTEYNTRMTAFYEAQKMKGSVTWSMRSGRRVDDRHLEGREGQLAWLQSRGFLKR